MPTSFAKPINDIATTVAAPYTAGSGSLTVASAAGITLGGNQWIRVSTFRSGAPLSILKATAVSGNVLTIAGAADGYTDVNLISGDAADLRVMAGALADLHTAVNALEASIAGSTVTGNTQGGTTSNPTPTTLWSIQPTDSTKGPFQAVLGGSQFASTWDSVLYLGYNGAGGGRAVLASEPLLTWNIEQDYEYPPGNHVMETYAEFWNAAHTQHVRPWFAQVNRSTGSTSFVIDVHDTNGFFSVNSGDPIQYFKVFAGGVFVRGIGFWICDSTGVNTKFSVDPTGEVVSNGGVLTVNDGNGSSGQQLFLQSNGTYASPAIRTASAAQPLYICPNGARLGIGANGFNYNAALQILPAAATDALSIESTSGSPSYQFLKIDQYGHQVVGGAAPTIAAEAGAGTGPTATVGGNDVVGVITVTTGTSPAAGATVAAIHFAAAFAAAPKSVHLTAANGCAATLAGAGAVWSDAGNLSTNGFTLNVGAAALAASTTYKWYYHVLG
jgi:hypothetical protein